MLEKLGLATAITFSLYLLVKVPNPAGPKLGGHQTLSHQLVAAPQGAIAARPQP
ncbi:MAG: hypothetical protein HC860_21160 [Alkalinema sp. RU_4_3]|nr:hypothetical protein [Alkalinema sp. RU_4_3]